MDINRLKFTNPILELGTVMDHPHNFHDQLPFDPPIWPNYPLQTHQVSASSSNQVPASGTVFADQVENLHRMIEQEEEEEEPEEELGAMKEMMYKIAAMQPVDIDPASIRKPKRQNIRISDDPQSVAARHRRERISEKIRILQRLVPGGTKMDTASMLEEAIRYVKFLKRHIRQLQSIHHPPCTDLGHVATTATGWPVIPGEYGFGGVGNGKGDPTSMKHEVIRD
ncbi:transcription factor HEC3-like [Diospyros lotus]|uniref:transcription factor HEC3-like n=1 Tax=Diospyros lotus TaxID=55363 RepID=UPI002258C6FB|nr:transcription factor HEC3-like [Diospyros lotus]